MNAFAFAHGREWRRCVAALGRPRRGLGFVYFTDALVAESHRILDALKSETGVENWIGTVRSSRPSATVLPLADRVIFPPLPKPPPS